MRHIAVDLGVRKSQVCIREEDGRILREFKCGTEMLVAALDGLAPARVILETCAQAFAVAQRLMAAGFEVRVVPATLVRQLGVGQRKLKTDKRDAQVLSEASCRLELPSVHIPSRLSQDRKTTLGMRQELVECRTKLINSVRGWLRSQLVTLPSGATETFAHRVRALLEPNAEGYPAAVERQLQTIESLNAAIKEADEETKQAARTDPVCQRLMSVPGVGPLVSLGFVASIDDVTRFKSAHAVSSYLGLTPGEDSSSERTRRLSITKAGPARARQLLVQASWVMMIKKPYLAESRWALEVARRRGAQIAVVALARKLSGILYAMWRDDRSYVPRPQPTQAAAA